MIVQALPSDYHLSPIPVSIVLGCCAANMGPLATPGVMNALKPGLSLASSTILRTGIVLVGLKLSAAQILALGWVTVPAAACSVGTGVVVIPALAARAGLTPKLGSLEEQLLLSHWRTLRAENALVAGGT